MNISHYEEILEKCFESYPFLRNGYVDYRPVGEHAIRLEYDDGHRCEYDSRLNAFRNVRTHDDSVSSVEHITDEYCRSKFANNLNEAMIRTGYTQQALARDTGLSIGSVNSYLYSKASPTITKLTKIAHVLGCTMDELLS